MSGQPCVGATAVGDSQVTGVTRLQVISFRKDTELGRTHSSPLQEGDVRKEREELFKTILRMNLETIIFAKEKEADREAL